LKAWRGYLGIEGREDENGELSDTESERPEVAVEELHRLFGLLAE
jgi:hypothetical protein